MNNDQLNSAISAHSRWKSRLLMAIEQGTSDISANDARRDDQCQFGKWLNETPGLRKDPHYNKVHDLHKLFHQEAGKVLDLALAATGTMPSSP